MSKAVIIHKVSNGLVVRPYSGEEGFNLGPDVAVFPDITSAYAPEANRLVEWLKANLGEAIMTAEETKTEVASIAAALAEPAPAAES